MPNWDLLIPESLLVAVLPAAYARYRRPVRKALVIFLQHLPPIDQEAIFAAQAALSPNAPAGERLALLARTCPALQKLGQTLARDRRLVPAFRRRLQALESLPASTPLPAIEDLLARELTPSQRRAITLAPPILAEGSVALVIPFRPPGKHAATGVLKILKPGIEGRLERELYALAHVGTYLDEECDALGLPPLDYENAFSQVRDKLLEEIRLDHEQRHLQSAATLYRGNPAVRIPALLDPCTRRITAMERITGEKITDHRLRPPAATRRLAENAAAAVLATPLFSPDPNTLFHADPHAGNLFLTDDRRLAILDWSLAATLSETERIALAQVLLGALTLNPARVATALAALAHRDSAPAALNPVAEAAVARVRCGTFPGLAWLTALLDAAVQTARLRVRPDLLLFRRALHALDGVLADIHANGPPPTAADTALAGALLTQLAREWPQRLLTPPTSRAYGTRLSTADLTELLLTLPLAATERLLASTTRPYHAPATP
jgi:ubiquinone biosynthesis protein